MKVATLAYRNAKGFGSLVDTSLDPLLAIAKEARRTGAIGNVKGITEGVVMATWRTAPAYEFTVESGKLQPKA